MLKVRLDFVLVFTGYHFKILGDNYQKVKDDNDKYITLLSDKGCIVHQTTLYDGTIFYTIILNKAGIMMSLNYINRSGQIHTMMSQLKNDIEGKRKQYPDFLKWCRILPTWNLDLKKIIDDYLDAYNKEASDGKSVIDVLKTAHGMLLKMCS